jgi:hypothetical protein
MARLTRMSGVILLVEWVPGWSYLLREVQQSEIQY